jgi:hypothetical protein
MFKNKVLGASFFSIPPLSHQPCHSVRTHKHAHTHTHTPARVSGRPDAPPLPGARQERCLRHAAHSDALGLRRAPPC